MALSWVIAGGGTGGHVTPALALAEVIVERGDRVLLIGSERGLEARLVPEAGFELLALRTPQVMGRGALGRVAGALGILAQVGRANAALARAAADIVISVGGYAALPAALAAGWRRTPLALVEPNAVPGRSNRLMARFARRIFLGFESAGRHLHARTDSECVGVPLRRSLIQAFESAPDRGRPRPPLRLLVFGGSQGARQINDALRTIAPELRGRALEIFHQSGERDREAVAEAYAAADLRAEVVAFENDMPSRYRWAQLAVCRAGALTTAELAMAGLPALLVPYPFAADDHQRANAEALARAGAAVCLESRPLDVSDLALRLRALSEDPERLEAMSAAASRLARPHAAGRIVDSCLRLLAGGAS